MRLDFAVQIEKSSKLHFQGVGYAFAKPNRLNALGTILGRHED